MSAAEGLQKYGRFLTTFEKEEITKYPKVYYCGQGCADKIDASTSGPNDGFDTSEGEYIFRTKDHIAYRYEILEELGSGAFGQVMKAIDHFDDQVVALKLIRNQRKVLQQAVQEINILEHVNSHDPKNLYGIVRMIESFSFRGHTCISYELLGANLYEYLKEKDFYPMPLSTIRGIAARMLVALTFLGRENIMHCDLKPENILIRGSDPSVVKLVDLGSASFDASNSYMYIQSRFYRAPEVILEQKYSKAIDWWSFGCILCELANGDPVFPGDDEKDQFSCIMEYLGTPPESFIEASSARRKREFFDEHLQPRVRQTKKGKERVPSSKSLAKFLGVAEDDDFLSFVRQFLQWDPAARVAPREAMRHKWISDEFVFPTKAVEPRPSVSHTNGDSASAPAAPETSNAAKSTASPKAGQNSLVRSAKHSAVIGPVATAATWSSTQMPPEPSARTVRTGSLPDNVHHSPGAASVPPAADAREAFPRATAQSTGGAPRRPTASQRHGGQPYRGRPRRSTEMTDVEMPGEGSHSASMTLGSTAMEEKSRDFLLAADGSGTQAVSPTGAAARNALRNGTRLLAPPALKQGVLSPVVLAMPAASPPSASCLPAPLRSAPKRSADDSSREESRDGVAATRNTASGNTPKGSKNGSSDTLTSADRSSRVLEMRRKYKAGTAPVPQKGDAGDRLEDSTRSGGNGALRFATITAAAAHDKDPPPAGLSYSSKQRQGHEPAPTTPPKPAKGKSASERRREYSITLDGSPSPPPVDSLQPRERPHVHTKDYVLPSETGLANGDHNVSLLSASRPHEPGSSFMFAGRHANRTSAEGAVHSSGETVMLSSPPSGSPGPFATSGAGTAGMTVQQTRDLAFPQRRATGRPLPVGGLVRLAPPRQQLAQRQRTSLVPGLGESKGPSSPTTALPPLTKNFVR